jgi:glyoxylase-like metal-dependent hydrolase (beta-lactamase superfamily II)
MQQSMHRSAAVRSVQILTTGSVRIRPEQADGTRKPLYWWLLTSRRWSVPDRPIQVFVIDHPRGLVLFDTGQDRAAATDPAGYFPGGPLRVLYGRLARFDIAPTETLSAQLSAVGRRLEDVRAVVVSHLHSDHIGGLTEIASHAPDADVHVSAEEWASLARPFPRARGLLIDRIALPGLRWHQVTFSPVGDPELYPFTAVHDLFGDGSLILLPTPGHTPGSVSLLVRRDDGPPLLLVGDLAYSAVRMRAGFLPGVGSRRRMRISTRRLLDLADRLGAPVLPAHDPDAASRLRASSAPGPERSL